MEASFLPLFTIGADGAPAYRIPTIICLRSGKILVFCEARRNSLSDSGNIDIVMRSSDGAGFSPERVIVSGRGNTVGNPCPLQDPSTGRLFLMYNANDADKPEDVILRGNGPRTVWITHSDDDGETWSIPEDITESVKPKDWTWYAIGPCHGISLPDGRLIYGANHAVLDARRGQSGAYRSHILISDDHGAHWRVGHEFLPGTNECALAAYWDGGLLLNARYIAPEGLERKLCRVQSYASDGEHFQTCDFVPELPDPCCQGSLLTVHTLHGEETLFSNCASASRDRLTVYRSADRGVHWAVEREIWSGPAAYSDMAQLPDGRIALVFEAGEQHPYEGIFYTAFNLTQ